MMMVWVKMIMEGSALLQNSPLMQLVFRISSLRWGVNTNLLAWLSYGISKYSDFIAKQKPKSLTIMLEKNSQNNIFKLEKEMNVPGHYDIMVFIKCVLSVFKVFIS